MSGSDLGSEGSGGWDLGSGVCTRSAKDRYAPPRSPMGSDPAWAQIPHGLRSPMGSDPPWAQIPHGLRSPMGSDPLWAQIPHGLRSRMGSDPPWAQIPHGLRSRMGSDPPWARIPHGLTLCLPPPPPPLPSHDHTAAAAVRSAAAARRCTACLPLARRRAQCGRRRRQSLDANGIQALNSAIPGRQWDPGTQFRSLLTIPPHHSLPTHSSQLTPHHLSPPLDVSTPAPAPASHAAAPLSSWLPGPTQPAAQRESVTSLPLRHKRK